MRKLLRHILRGKKKDTLQKTKLETKLRQIVQMRQTGTLVVIITDCIDLDEKLVKQVGEKNEILWVHVLSCQEMSLVSEDGYIQFGDMLVETPRKASVQQSYIDLVQEKLHETQRLVQSV